MTSYPSDQTAELLSEGGFEAWNELMHDFLSLHRHDHHLHLDRDVARLDYMETAQAAAALTMIISLVELPLLKRVPFPDRWDLGRLMPSLKARAQPFRVLDLPPEIRNRIYTHVMPKGNAIYVPLHRHSRPLRKCSNSPRNSAAITKVSRQVRQESLALFYTQSHFKLYLWDNTGIHKLHRTLKDCISICAGQIPPGQIKNFRKVTLMCQMRKAAYQNIRLANAVFTYSPATGFCISVTPALTEDSQAKLDEHVRRIESNRKLVNLTGEAIVLSLASDDKLWEHGGLVLAT